jgi:hypothetical protein
VTIPLRRVHFSYETLQFLVMNPRYWSLSHWIIYAVAPGVSINNAPSPETNKNRKLSIENDF